MKNVLILLVTAISVFIGIHLANNVIQPWLQERKEINVENQGNKDYVKMEDCWKVIDVNYVENAMIVTLEGQFDRRLNVIQRVTSWYIPVKGEMWRLEVRNDKVVLDQKKDEERSDE